MEIKLYYGFYKAFGKYSKIDDKIIGIYTKKTFKKENNYSHLEIFDFNKMQRYTSNSFYGGVVKLNIDEKLEDLQKQDQ